MGNCLLCDGFHPVWFLKGSANCTLSPHCLHLTSYLQKYEQQFILLSPVVPLEDKARAVFSCAGVMALWMGMLVCPLIHYTGSD